MAKPTRIVCFGPGPQFKGGIANYNLSLAKTFDKMPDTEVFIVSWTQQYPAIVPREFKDPSRSNKLAGTGIKEHYITNYNKPWTWKATYKYILDLKPDIVILQWSIALQGLPMAAIAKRLRKHPEIEVLLDCHLVVQKEASSLDKKFTRRCFKHIDTFITHSQKTSDELAEIMPELKFSQSEVGTRTKNPDERTIIKLYHPVYDMFEKNPEFDVEAFKKEFGLREHVFLFFGFIRKYKGLHHCIESFAQVAKQRDDVSLLIVGELFWNTLDKSKLSTRIKKAVFGFAKSIFLRKSDDEQDYRPLDLIKEFGIEDRVATKTEYVPNEDVHKYFQASDAIVLYYLTATPSGVESMAYNFDMPILATKVGHFPETVQHGYNGYLAEAEDIDSMAEQMMAIIEKPIDRKNVGATADKMSWENYAQAILNR